MAFLGYPDEYEEKRSDIFVSQRSKSVLHAMQCVREEWQEHFERYEQAKGMKR
jgi:hypothetical protein